MEKTIKIATGIGLLAVGGLLLYRNQDKNGFWYGAGSVLLIAVGSNVLFNKKG